MLIVRRALRLVFVFFVVTFVTFVLLDMTPGDPAERFAGLNATPEVVEAVRIDLGLDGSLWERYLRWLGNALTLDFGDSIVTKGFSSFDLIRETLPKTLELMVLADRKSTRLNSSHPV